MNLQKQQTEIHYSFNLLLPFPIIVRRTSRRKGVFTILENADFTILESADFTILKDARLADSIFIMLMLENAAMRN